MVYKMVSSKAVVAKIISDLQLSEEDIRITDIKQWIGDACMNIGSVNQLEHKVVVLPLDSYQCKLPCDLERLNSVAYSVTNCGGWIPMKRTTGTFSVYDKKHDCCNCEMLIQDSAMFPLVKNMFNLTNDKQALDKLNQDDNLRKTLSCLINQYTICSRNGKIKGLVGGTNFSNTVQYDIKPGNTHLISNVPEGFVKISYHAIITDDEGMPMIPDMPSYFEAIYWYVAMKLYYPKYLSGEVPQHVYYDMKRSYNFYRKQAYAESLLPNQDEMTNIKNTWHTLVPEIDEENTFFSTTGDREEVYNQNYGGWSVWN